jgi:hypothetical protein
MEFHPEKYEAETAQLVAATGRALTWLSQVHQPWRWAPLVDVAKWVERGAREARLERSEVLTALAELFVSAGVQGSLSGEKALVGLRAVAAEAGPGPLGDLVADFISAFA